MPNDHFTRYMPQGDTHRTFRTTAGECAEMDTRLSRSRFRNALWGNVLAVALVAFSIAMVVVVIGGVGQ